VKLVGIDLHPFALALRRPFVTGAGRVEARRGFVVTLRGEGGCFGHGEVSPLAPWQAVSVEACWSEAVQLGAAMQGRALEGVPDVEAWHAGVWAAVSPAVRFGFESAALDLLGRREGVPVARLLSADARRVVECNAVLGGDGVDELAGAANTLIAKGFSTLKLKVGAASVAEDVRRVAAVRAAIGGGVALRLDANGAWGPKEAAAFLGAVESLGVDYVEDPVARLADFGPLARRFAVPLAWDAATAEPGELVEAMVSGAVSVVVLKPAFLGGALPTLALARVARAHGVRVVVTSALDGALGRLAAAHVAAALPDAQPAGLATAHLLAGDLSAAWPDRASLDLGGCAGLGVTDLRTPGADASGLTAVRLGAAARSTVEHSHAPLPWVHQARWRGGSTALETVTERWTFGELLANADALAGSLFQQGVRQGDRVLVQATSSGRLVALLVALWRLGAVPVLLHPALTAAERAAAAVASEAVAAALATPGDRLGDLPALRWLEARPAAPAPLQDTVELSAAAVVVMSSGSTGAPKPVALSWSNLAFSAAGSAAQLGHVEGDRWLAVLPLCHVGGLSIVYRCALLGTTVVLRAPFDASEVAALFVEGAVTMASLVPTMALRVVEALGGRRASARLRVVLIGGGPIDDGLLARCRDAGLPAVPTFGLSEAASQVATASPVDGEGRLQPLPFTCVQLIDADDDGIGELLVDGPTVSAGVEGALGTGDFGRLGAWGLEVVGRRTDRIVSGGENVHPQEVERALLSHPAVRQACVVGVEDAAWGQRVVAVVVARGEVGAEALTAHCRLHLARHKVPGSIEFYDTLPEVGPGKVDRRAVRERLIQESPRRRTWK